MRRLFFQFSDDPGDVSGGAHVVEREFDGAVGTDEEGGADHAFDDFAVVLFLPKGTPFFEHVFVGVGEQGKGEVVFLAEGTSLSTVSGEMPTTSIPRSLSCVRLSRKSQASVVHPGVLARG